MFFLVPSYRLPSCTYGILRSTVYAEREPQQRLLASPPHDGFEQDANAAAYHIHMYMEAVRLQSRQTLVASVVPVLLR